MLYEQSQESSTEAHLAFGFITDLYTYLDDSFPFISIVHLPDRVVLNFQNQSSMRFVCVVCQIDRYPIGRCLKSKWEPRMSHDTTIIPPAAEESCIFCSSIADP